VVKFDEKLGFQKPWSPDILYTRWCASSLTPKLQVCYHTPTLIYICQSHSSSSGGPRMIQLASHASQSATNLTVLTKRLKDFA